MTEIPTTATRFEPPVTDVTAPFWEATKHRELLVQWCTACEEPVFFPRAVCPRCLETTLEWRPSTGRGTVYAVTVEHQAQNPLMAARVPYAVALVDLDDGIRMMSNVVGCDPHFVTIGMAVAVTWESMTDGRNLPLFEPVGN
jgi:uncharacterized OB-fold protein